MARRIAQKDQYWITAAIEDESTPRAGPRYSTPIPLPPLPPKPVAPAVVYTIKMAEIRLNAAKRDLRQFRHAYGDIPELADVLAAINRCLADTSNE